MKFVIQDLSVLAYANGFTLWHYKTGAGDLLAVESPGFFDPAADMLASGDMVLVSSPAGGRMLCLAAGNAGLVTARLT
jgi:hypothetical protein